LILSLFFDVIFEKGGREKW